MTKDIFGNKITHDIYCNKLKNTAKRSLGRNDRDILYLRAKCRCEACGTKIPQPHMQVGHKIAFSKGGATTLANSVCLCYGCNKLQGTGSFESLKKKLDGTFGKRSKRKPTKINNVKPTKQPEGLGIFEEMARSKRMMDEDMRKSQDMINKDLGLGRLF